MKEELPEPGAWAHKGIDGKEYQDVARQEWQDTRKLFLVMRERVGAPNEIQGVFTTEPGAIAACRTWQYGYCELEADKNLPDDTVPLEWKRPIPPPKSGEL